MSPISINVRFSLPSSNSEQNESVIIEQCFDESNCEEARLGLAPGVEAVKPQGGDYSYSGMHDHGPLPPPKEGGDFAKLVGMVNEAKKSSDNLLTKLIKEENAAVAEAKKQIKTKKQKIDDVDSHYENKSDDRNTAIRQKVEN